MQRLNLEDSIEQSAALSDFLYETLGETAQLDIRGQIAMAYLSMSLDHRNGILLLVDRGAMASATALQRPLVEAFISGAYMYSCATDQEVRHIATMDRPPPSVQTMAQRLRRQHVFGRHFEILRGHYSILGDYAHGHKRQLSRWLGQASVGPRYSEDQMVETLRHSDIVGLLAAIQREIISNRPTTRLLEILEAAMLQQNYSHALSTQPVG